MRRLSMTVFHTGREEGESGASLPVFSPDPAASSSVTLGR